MASEKQISWAKDISAQKLNEVREIVIIQQTEEKRQRAQSALSLLESKPAETHPTFWIDNRRTAARDLMTCVLTRERLLNDAQAVVSGEKSPGDFDYRALCEFLQLIDSRAVNATRAQRDKIYRAMCAKV